MQWKAQDLQFPRLTHWAKDGLSLWAVFLSSSLPQRKEIEQQKDYRCSNLSLLFPPVWDKSCSESRVNSWKLSSNDSVWNYFPSSPSSVSRGFTTSWVGWVACAFQLRVWVSFDAVTWFSASRQTFLATILPFLSDVQNYTHPSCPVHRYWLDSGMVFSSLIVSTAQDSYLIHLLLIRCCFDCNGLWM